jgi:hypothetical protein
VYSIVIPHKDEPLLQWTIDNILREEPTVEIISIDDTPVKGIGYRRDQGIRKAKYDTVFLIDAHMDFSKGFFHSMAAQLEENRKRAICSVCRSMNEDRSAGVIHGKGAYLYETMGGKAFVSRWNQSQGQPGSILGGAYCISKEWYLDGLNAPWRFHRCWGKSEQIIGITNFLCGGENIVNHDVWSSHFFKKSRFATQAYHNQVKVNTWFIIFCLCDEKSRKRILDECFGTNLVPTYGTKTLNERGAITDMRSFLEKNSVREYSDFPFTIETE